MDLNYIKSVFILIVITTATHFLHPHHISSHGVSLSIHPLKIYKAFIKINPKHIILLHSIFTHVLLPSHFLLIIHLFTSFFFFTNNCSLSLLYASLLLPFTSIEFSCLNLSLPLHYFLKSANGFSWWFVSVSLLGQLI